MNLENNKLRLGIIYGSTPEAKTFAERFIGHLINNDQFCTACEDLELKIKCDKCRRGLLSSSDKLYYYQKIGENIPLFIDDPNEFLPHNLPELDFLLVINIHKDLLSGLPELLNKKKVKAIIIPLEDPSWVPPGLQIQVLKAFEKEGIQAAFPKPFCALNKEEDEYNKIDFNITKNHQYIDQFIDIFKIGTPKVSLKINQKENYIEDVCVHISAPCGSTYFILQQLRGDYFKKFKNHDSSINEKISRAHHSYPCSASMDADNILKDSILHIAGYIIRNVIRNELCLDIEENKKLTYVIK
ncbi:MAG: thymidylate synthase [Candidatus Lokiarchaeota archaeon]|nr:thymidylate synthase [Candidatus Lokiarchaeota archaeon]